jgi:broad specificity phosphatase PhoE
MRLYLVRHGQTAWNLERRLQGHTDIELDEMGRVQALQVSTAFLGVGVDRILSSDLARCTQTAQRIAEVVGVEPEFEPRLKERSFGVLEGRQFMDFRAEMDAEVAQSGQSRLDHRPENGESLRQVWDRIGDVADELSARSQRAIVVSHGGTLSLLLSRLIDAGPEAAHAFRLTNASITELFQRPDRTWAIERLNDRAHLEVAREGTAS